MSASDVLESLKEDFTKESGFALEFSPLQILQLLSSFDFDGKTDQELANHVRRMVRSTRTYLQFHSFDV